MTIEIVSGPATEPLTVAEVLQHCRIDASNQELAPSAPAVALASPAAAGNLSAGAYRWRVTFVTADGETEGGTVSAAVTVANPAVNGQAALTGIPLGGSLVTARKLYRTTAGGSSYLLLATISDNTTTTYADNIADSSLGAGAPSINTTSDPQITRLIKSARQEAELMLNRYLITQTVDVHFDEFPRAQEFLALPPVQSVTSVTYLDADGVEQTWDAAEYRVDAVRAPARITLAYGYSWPTTRDVSQAVAVRCVVGYGAANAVPDCIKQWMLARIKHNYDHPEGAEMAGAEYVNRLLDSERVSARY